MKTKLSDLDLSFLDDDDEAMVDVGVVWKGVEETLRPDLMIIKVGAKREPKLGSKVSASVEGGSLLALLTQIL